MALPRRPSLRFELPPQITAGERLEGGLVLEVTAPISVNTISVLLEGETRLTPQASLTSLQVYPSPVDVEARVFSGEVELPVGEHRFRFSLEIPAGAAPSYETEHEHRRYELSAVVAVSWWMPARLSQPVEVVCPPTSSPARPCSALSAPVEGGGLGLIELALDTDAAHPGEVLSGWAQLLRGDASKIGRLQISFGEFLGDGVVEGDAFYRRRLRSVEVAFFDAAALLTGEPLPFSLALPADLAPSFRSLDRRRWCEVSAALLDRSAPARSASPSDVARAPIQIVAAGVPIERAAPRERPLSLFEATARASGGVLDPLWLEVRGVIGGHPFTMGPSRGEDDPPGGVVFSVQAALSELAGDEPPGVRAARARLEGVEVCVSARGLRAVARRPLRSADEALERLEALAELADALGRPGGPYR